MAVTGSLRETSLADVLQLLALGRKSGCLSVADRESFGYVYFDRGLISYASIVNRRDRIGDLLVKNGLVTPQALAEAVAAQDARRGERLGEILVERGEITREVLARYIRLQVEEAVYFLFTWRQGIFTFAADRVPEAGAMLFAINPENVLLEGARRVDEWSLIEKKIPSLDLVFGLAATVAELPEGEITREQRRVLPLIDGTRSVREVVDASGLVEFDAVKALFGLVQAGFAREIGRRPRAPGEGARGVEEHRNLGVAFYRTGMLPEASREFHRVLQAAPGDASAAFYLGLVDLRGGRPQRAVRRFRSAIEHGAAPGAAFHDAALALEALGLVEDAALALDEASATLGSYPPLLLSRAVLLCKASRPREAARAFAAYRRAAGDGAQPPAVYYAFAMIAEGACGRISVASRLAEEGARRYPHVGQVMLHAGAVRERLAAWEEAEMLYRAAVQAEPELAPARLALGDALYRRGAHAEAAEQYERLLDLAPDRADEAAFRLGNVRYGQGARAEAARLWRRALELNPDHAEARTKLELIEGAAEQRSA